MQRATVADTLALCDMSDAGLKGDYWFPRKQMEGIIARPTSATWVVRVDGVCAGFLIFYSGSTLHNLLLVPEYRSRGIGQALIEFFQPELIRSKSNMGAGNPDPFYAAQGYAHLGADPERPHIHLMGKPATPRAAATSTAAAEPPPTPQSPYNAGIVARELPITLEAQQAADAEKWRQRQASQRAARARRAARKAAGTVQPVPVQLQPFTGGPQQFAGPPSNGQHVQ